MSRRGRTHSSRRSAGRRRRSAMQRSGWRAARTIFGGGFGVFVFFALSGYLLFRPLAAATFGGERVDMRRYALNRLLRTLPLYYAVVAVLLVVQEGGGTPGQWWRFLTLTEN